MNSSFIHNFHELIWFLLGKRRDSPDKTRDYRGKVGSDRTSVNLSPTDGRTNAALYRSL